MPFLPCRACFFKTAISWSNFMRMERMHLRSRTENIAKVSERSCMFGNGEVPIKNASPLHFDSATQCHDPIVGASVNVKGTWDTQHTTMHHYRQARAIRILANGFHWWDLCNDPLDSSCRRTRADSSHNFFCVHMDSKAVLPQQTKR